jgi:LytR cell envelope-related transcriptional attenuator
VPPTTTTEAPPGVPTSEVLVEVLNGTGATGLAGSVASALAREGFLINGTGDAESFTHATNEVAYPPGLLSSAETLADHVLGASVVKESSQVPSGEVWLIVGSSYAGVD